jgi:hypothetical protein
VRRQVLETSQDVASWLKVTSRDWTPVPDLQKLVPDFQKMVKKEKKTSSSRKLAWILGSVGLAGILLGWFVNRMSVSEDSTSPSSEEVTFSTQSETDEADVQDLTASVFSQFSSTSEEKPIGKTLLRGDSEHEEIACGIDYEAAQGSEESMEVHSVSRSKTVPVPITLDEGWVKLKRTHSFGSMAAGALGDDEASEDDVVWLSKSNLEPHDTLKPSRGIFSRLKGNA